jgi:VanZ family protein
MSQTAASSSRRIRSLAWILAAISWTILIWYLSNRSGDTASPGKPSQSNLPFPHADKLVHLGLFAILAFLWLQTEIFPARLHWLILVGCVLLGALDEWHQASSPGRESSLGDLLADVVGIGLGLWFHQILMRKMVRT